MENSLIRIIESIFVELEKAKFSCGVLQKYRACFNTVIKYCIAHNLIPIYSKKLIQGFLDEIETNYKKGKITYHWLRERRKATHLIIEYSETGLYNYKHFYYNSKYKLSTPYFKKFLKDEYRYYKETYHLSEGSNEHNYYVTEKFCFYIENLSFTNFNNLTINEIVNFINSVKKTNKGNIKTIIHHLKKILTYLSVINIVHINLDLSILKPQIIPPKEIVFFSKEEMIKILNAIDRNTDIGKRDYAIILLGITTGLRACDVAKITLNNINWEKEYIKVVQSKTRKEIKIPLLSNVSNSLADYILNARQKVNTKSLFLTIQTPINQIESHSLSNIVKKYCTKANIKKETKETFHSLRRSFCTWLSQDLISVDLIAECVGHSNVNTVERYISVSPIMTQCCLDFSGINPLPSEV